MQSIQAIRVKEERVWKTESTLCMNWILIIHSLTTIYLPTKEIFVESSY